MPPSSRSSYMYFSNAIDKIKDLERTRRVHSAKSILTKQICPGQGTDNVINNIGDCCYVCTLQTYILSILSTAAILSTADKAELSTDQYNCLFN